MPAHIVITRVVRAAGGVFTPGHLGELTRIVPFAMVDAVLAECGRTERRARLLPARVVVYLVLAAGLFADLGWGLVWDKLVWSLPEGPRPGGAALHYARKRLGPEPLRRLFDLLAGPGASAARWRDLLVCAFDGTELDVPDSAANRAAYGKPGTGAKQAGYPHLRLVALIACGTRQVLAAAFGPTATTERDLAQSLFTALGQGLLVLVDRGFPSAAWLGELRRTEADFLARIPANWRPKTIGRLADGTRLVLVGTLRLRLIEAQITIATAEGRRVGAYRLATTLCDPNRHPALELIELYHQRWEIETAYAELKSTLLHRRVLRAHRPREISQEVWALLALYQVLRCCIDDAVTGTEFTPLQTSFTLARESARNQVIAAAGIVEDEQIDLKGRIGAELLARPLPARRLRSAPRAIKRAISKHRAKGTVTRRTYKATLEIALIDTR